MKKREIPVTVIETFDRSGCSLVLAAAPGALPAGTAKDGTPKCRSFEIGAIALVDSKFQTILSPVDLSAVEHFARRVIDGDPRAKTESTGMVMLASALVALLVTAPTHEPAETSTSAPTESETV